MNEHRINFQRVSILDDKNNKTNLIQIIPNLRHLIDQKKNFIPMIFFLIFFFFLPVDLLPLPFNQYAYMLAREKIREHDRGVQALNHLNPQEKTVNLYLEFLRARDFIDTKKYFYPSRPIESEMINITTSPFYQFLKLLPKGGNLHLHEFQILDRTIFLQSIKTSPEYDLLYICDQNSCGKSKYYLSYFQVNIPSGWTKVKGSNWTIEDIVRKTTLIGILNDLPKPLYPTDMESRWNLASHTGVFGFYRDLVQYNVTRFKYMKLVLDQALAENVQLLEFRRGFFGNTYYFDEYGSKVLINASDELNSILEMKKDYLLQNPRFIDFIFILYNSRKIPKEQIQLHIDNLIDLHRLYPNIIRGYDMVGDEDQGHTLLYHNDNLIHLFNYSQLSNHSFHFFFHAGETNWPEEHLPSNHGDGVSTFENIYDAIVLRTRRIGHGLSLAKRPDMYQYIRQRQIAIEVCPASNQILGYVADLRNHPGIVYHRSGIPIVLAGDDPGSFGYNQLTVDFYLATMAWGLNLADLKQFAWNSIEYSSLTNDRKIEGLHKWETQWNLFIDYSYQLACHQTFSKVNINVSDVLPAYGPYDRSINITLFGSGFEIAICKEIRCRFDEQETIGIFLDLNEIICPTPRKNRHLSKVSIALIIDHQIMQSGISFQFLSPLFVIDDGTSPSKTDPIRTNHYPWILILFVVFFLF